MLLGIVATNDSTGEHLTGLAYAAVERGWQCNCFLTDQGVRLLHSQRLIELANSGSINLAVCEHSWEIYGSGNAPASAIMASQYKNAELAHLCDKVIVL